MPNAINNQLRPVARGGGGRGVSGKPRVPKQPHQHFIESSKVKRTLAPSSLMYKDDQTQRQSYF